MGLKRSSSKSFRNDTIHSGGYHCTTFSSSVPVLQWCQSRYQYNIIKSDNIWGMSSPAACFMSWFDFSNWGAHRNGSMDGVFQDREFSWYSYFLEIDNNPIKIEFWKSNTSNSTSRTTFGIRNSISTTRSEVIEL